MAQVIYPQRARTWDEILGTGLGQGLQYLAQNKLKDLAQRNQAQGLQALLPQFSPEQAQAFIQQSPEFQKQYLKQQMSGGTQAETPEQELKREKFLQPFLKGQSEDYNNAKKLYSKAKGMLENIKRNRKKFPGVLSGNIIPEKFRTDPDIRKYVADANTLVTLLAGSRKGQPTNFKVKLEQMSKPNLGMPIEAQIELLEDIIKDSEGVFNVQKKLQRIKEENKGRYPIDAARRLLEGELESSESSEYMGDIVQDDNGNILKWDPSQNEYRLAKKRG